MCIKVKFKDQDAYEARFRALQIVDERAAVKSVNGVLPNEEGAVVLTPADINAVSAEDVANIRGTFRINVTSSNGVYSADKTFDEIRAAYDAGQLPYVVYTSLTSNFVYTFAMATPKFISFESYSIFDDTLETVSLRIFSYTLENGSNIEKQISPYNGQGGIGIQSVEQTTTSTEDGGANVITVTKTDGTSSTFTVRNGSKGSTGATGARGATGATGATGADGKSAYQYAQESGYTGTETEFAEKLAQEQLYGTTLMLTPTQVSDAVSAGIPVRVQYVDNTWGFISFTSFTIVGELNAVVSQTIVYTNGEYILVELFGKRSDNTWSFMTPTLQPSSITDSGGYFNTDTVEGALQEIGAELAGINTLLGSGIQISFTILDATCTANAGQTFSEWIGSGYKALENGMMLSVPYGDEGVIFLDEAGVYALSLDGNTPVHGGDRIISGATYVSMNWGG